MTCLGKNNFTPSSTNPLLDRREAQIGRLYGKIYQVSQQKAILRFRYIFIAILVLLAIAGALALREYLLLKKIQATLMKPPGKAADSAVERPAVTPQKLRLVENIRISGDGSHVSASVRFASFKHMVEQNPEILRAWGRLVWKVLGNTPALCFKALSPSAPMAPLGAEVGECIVTLDGETVNQPMRNLGIWMTLSSREQINIETRRSGRKISYRLNRIP